MKINLKIIMNCLKIEKMRKIILTPITNNNTRTLAEKLNDTKSK